MEQWRERSKPSGLLRTEVLGIVPLKDTSHEVFIIVFI